MIQDSRDQFEQAYSEDNGGVPVAFLKLDRLGESYGTPKVARAWYWWKRARAGIVASQPAWRPMTEEPPFPFRGDIFSDGEVIINADWSGGGLIHGYWQSPNGDRSIGLVTHWKPSNPAITPPPIEHAGVRVSK